MTARAKLVEAIIPALCDINSRHHHEATQGDKIEARHIADRILERWPDIEKIVEGE